MVPMSEKALQQHIKKSNALGKNWWEELSERQREWIEKRNKEAAEQAQAWWEELPKKERSKLEKHFADTTKRNLVAIKVAESLTSPKELERLRLMMKYDTPEALAFDIALTCADFQANVTRKQTSTAAAHNTGTRASPYAAEYPAWMAAAKAAIAATTATTSDGRKRAVRKAIKAVSLMVGKDALSTFLAEHWASIDGSHLK